MSGDKELKGPAGWLPLYFDKYAKPDEPPPITPEEVKQLQAEAAEWNMQFEK